MHDYNQKLLLTIGRTVYLRNILSKNENLHNYLHTLVSFQTNMMTNPYNNFAWGALAIQKTLVLFEEIIGLQRTMCVQSKSYVTDYLFDDFELWLIWFRLVGLF